MRDYSGCRVAVIGDYMLDKWLKVDSAEMSQEAMAPKILNPLVRWTLGGAGNVVANFKSLGAEVFCCGVVGPDEEGLFVLDELYSLGIENKHIQLSDAQGQTKTTQKIRFLVKGQQILRWDEEDINFELNEEASVDVAELILDQEGIDVIVFADYDKGFCSKYLIKEIMKRAKEDDTPVMVDPKFDNFADYKGATIFKPNRMEARFISESERLLHIWFEDYKHTVITLGSQGMRVISGNLTEDVPAHKVEVADVTGAGDTVMAVLTLEYLRTKDIFKAAELANWAGALAVQKYGTVQLTVEELEAVADGG